MSKSQTKLAPIADSPILQRVNQLQHIHSTLQLSYQTAITDNKVLKHILNYKMTSTNARKFLAEKAIKKYGISVRQACLLFNLSRTAYYYEGCHPYTDLAEKRLLELSEQYPHFGYWKYYSLLRSEGYIINHKRVYRIYKQAIQLYRNDLSSLP